MKERKRNEEKEKKRNRKIVKYGMNTNCKMRNKEKNGQKQMEGKQR